MGLFDWFRKPKPAVPLPQLAYDVAYFILPHYAFNEQAKLAELCLHSPAAAGPFFYAMAAKARQVEPTRGDAETFRWHHGRLDADHEYSVLEFPAPPPFDLSALSAAQADAALPPVLAPHFTAIVRGRGTGTRYFVLGQAPIGGGTTLRRLQSDGVNANLGPGPTPTLPAFLDAIRARPT